MKVAAEHQPGAGQPDATELLRVLNAGLSPGLLERALTHRSFAYENGGLPTNERLEFLGDSVLGVVVTDALFRSYPDLPEGQLAKLRAAVVNMRALAGVARGLRLGDYVRLGRGEDGTGGRDKSSILADTLEAVIGAVYIERGLPEAAGLVHRLFDPVIARSARLGAGLDWKTSLQELTASEALGVPEYHVEESGPDHQKSFRAAVRVGGHVFGMGEGRSKKEAEQQAAEAAWNAISNGEAPMDASHADRPAEASPANKGGGGQPSPGGTGAANTAQAGSAGAGAAHTGGSDSATMSEAGSVRTDAAGSANPGGTGSANPGGTGSANAGGGGSASGGEASPGGTGAADAAGAGSAGRRGVRDAPGNGNAGAAGPLE